MIDLHVALGDYLQTRRALGTQLQGWPESFLRQFVAFLIAQESDVITTALALRWTFRPPDLRDFNAPAVSRNLGKSRQVSRWQDRGSAATHLVLACRIIRTA